MKRMIPQSLITWVKSLFHRVSPGIGEGDIEVGGNLEVDGKLTPNTLQINNNEVNIINSEGGLVGHFQAYVVTEQDFTIASYDSNTGLYMSDSTLNIGAFDGSLDSFEAGVQITKQVVYISAAYEVIASINASGFSITSGKRLTMGNTVLTEDQLKKLLALIPAESAE